MEETKNILLVGVGGQGIILASKILSQGLINAGYDVKMSEVHGMAQRGGSVTTQVRFGDKVHSPIIGKGQADIIVAFEKMEAYRWLDYLKTDGKVVVNNYAIPSVPSLTGKIPYPNQILEDAKELVENLTVVQAADIAVELGNIKAQNIVLLGALLKAMDISDMEWDIVLKENIKERFLELNQNALKAGMDAV